MKRLVSILNYNCPRCYQSNLFKKPFQFTKPLAMNASCENCGLNFDPEPGFYFGAMFFSYTIAGILFVSIATTLVFKFGWSLTASMSMVCAIGAIIFFKLLRLSRSLWIHTIVSYSA